MPATTPDEQHDFLIEIYFDKSRENPSNALRVLSELISTFESLDKDLLSSIDSQIKPIILLEEIETGSIKAWLKDRVESIDDTGLKDLDWKKLVGKYLVDAKYAIIKFLEDKTEITDRGDIQKLEQELYILAKNTDVRKLPTYTPIPSAKLISNISKITTTVKSLNPGSHAKFIAESQEVNFNLEIDFSPESIEDLLTREKIQSKSIMILKVKKPDYLGESKWDLRHDRRPIEAKISDISWLKDFQDRKIDVRSGDSLRSEVVTTVKYDYNNEVIGTDYEIIAVLAIIKPEGNSQISIEEE